MHKGQGRSRRGDADAEGDDRLLALGLREQHFRLGGGLLSSFTEKKKMLVQQTNASILDDHRMN